MQLAEVQVRDLGVEKENVYSSSGWTDESITIL
jgi:hypothetical protein